jgi:predicted nuclease with RNAse H fold
MTKHLEGTLAVGIDLAVQNADTGVCRLIDRGEAIEAVFDLSCGDADLRQLIDWCSARGVTVAIDVPLGWPLLFRAFLKDLKLPSEEESETSGRKKYRFQSLRLRETDIELREKLLSDQTMFPQGKKPWPLSVSTDRLGAATMRWHAIKAGLKNSHSHVIETYPAAAAYIWFGQKTIAPKHLSTFDLSPKRLSIGQADGKTSVLPEDKLKEHRADALTAALVAALPEGDRRKVLPKDTDDERKRLRTEGWMELPESKEVRPNWENLRSKLAAERRCEPRT